MFDRKKKIKLVFFFKKNSGETGEAIKFHFAQW